MSRDKRGPDGFMPDRRYQRPLPGLDGCKRVLDVGPGTLPLPEATLCVDQGDTYLGYDYTAFRTCPVQYAEAEHLPFKNDSFDYAYCSHCLEHLDHPTRALAELQRVAPRGYVEVPTAMLDYLMQHGENHPRWSCLQVRDGIVFVERDPGSLSSFGELTQRWYLHKVTQMPDPLTKYEWRVRQKFWSDQKVLNASASWEPGRKAWALEIRQDGRFTQSMGAQVFE